MKKTTNTNQAPKNKQEHSYKEYTKNSLQKKIENKLTFQHEFGLVVDKKIPLCCFTLELTKENGGEILESIVPAILKLEMQFVLLGIGTEKYQKIFTELSKRHPLKIKIIPHNSNNLKKTYQACDLGLLPAHNTQSEKELAQYLQYGVVPVCSAKHAQKYHIINYHPATEEGSGFIFENNDGWSIFASVVRARETHYLPYDWKNIQKQDMNLIEDAPA